MSTYAWYCSQSQLREWDEQLYQTPVQTLHYAYVTLTMLVILKTGHQFSVLEISFKYLKELHLKYHL